MHPRLATTALLAACVAGCVGHVAPVENTNRASIIWKDEAYRTCLEFSTAVAETSNRKLEAGVGYQGIEAKVAGEFNTGIARVYSVSDILQFGHASLFRLCEARANEIITNEEWSRLYELTFQKINKLLEVQVDVRHVRIVERRVKLRQEVRDTRKGLDEAENRADAARRRLENLLDKKDLVEADYFEAQREIRRIDAAATNTSATPSPIPRRHYGSRKHHRRKRRRMLQRRH